MKYEAITIKDIAKALGLSTSTVSRALRGSYEISAETRKLVLEYAEKLNYRPNPIALSLKEKRSRSIGIVVCEIANNFFSQVINGIESVAYKKGYYVIISQSHESFEREVANTQYLASRSVDGLLVSLSTETTDLSHFTMLHDKGLPIVYFDRIPEEMPTHKVIANNFNGAYQATEHLIHSGFKRIAHLTISPHLSITKERLAGYKAALADHRLPFDEAMVKYCKYGGLVEEETEEAVKGLLSLSKRPDAIVAASDKLSTGCLAVLARKKIRVPDEMGIVGFTNSLVTDIFHPSLTSIRQPAFEMGQVAMEMLIQLIESKHPVSKFETRVLNTELTVRSSSVKAG
ncbi:MAG TPA: LacI family DNA-binding transcriptional regulator [Puia sp.]|jgi:LacI family transcriptional regulator|nr:LacI family DNA-binding transcriptional regulator [Puia sp.]